MKTAVMVGMGMGALRHKVTGWRAPLNVMLSVTNRCNARCSYCDIPQRKQTELSTQEIIDLVDLLAERGCLRIGLWGGEPLVRKDIVTIVERCAAHGLWTTLDTNGYLFPQWADRLQNLSHLMISLDGRKEHHDANREAGSWDKAMAGGRCASERGLDFWTITVLTRHNLDDIDYMLDLGEELGFTPTFQVLHHTEEMAGDKGTPLMPADGAYHRALRKLRDAKEAGRPVGCSRKYLDYMLSWEDFGTPTSKTGHMDMTCMAGQLYCNVDTDGTVYPCSLLIGDFPAMNIREVGFDRAFANLQSNRCRACTATAFTEYNYLYHLDAPTVLEWVSALKRLGPVGSGFRLPKLRG